MKGRKSDTVDSEMLARFMIRVGRLRKHMSLDDLIR